ncbi:hypothetical protein G7047_16355 [Diaphorobacter sp. HDW4A]|uniref:hypothetical protein n=1 Tax=Diaphorobacter sp. HDW4A TaxID=2714924 RepID=UPI001408E210|nr:hypothetical protein [Diaphorobacter sp. HDW4A]QIL81309.1 hypothetical protein G7047_16355 [Diaphorobacter sp. HDW4A]
MKPLLLIAHPGHELRIFQWVYQTRPHVVVLTNGDGSIGQPRLEHSRQLLDPIGVQIREDWLASVPDSGIYNALLGTAPSPFQAWLRSLIDIGMQGHFDTVVADQAEGYNPSHDLCRVMANCLVRALRQSGRSIRSLEFPLIGHSCDPARQHEVEEEVTLTGAELAHKLSIMHLYASSTSKTLERELQTMLETFGEASFARECLYPAARTPYESNELPPNMPEFERIGEERFKAGIYRNVIRTKHLRQLAQDMLNKN